MGNEFGGPNGPKPRSGLYWRRPAAPPLGLHSFGGATTHSGWVNLRRAIAAVDALPFPARPCAQGEPLMPSSLNNLSIGRKVALSFAVVVAIVIGFGLFAVQRLGVVDASAAALRDNRLPSIEQLTKVAVLAERHRANLASVVMAGADSERAIAVASADKTGQALKAAWAAYAPL